MQDLLQQLFHQLKLHQVLVNILFDEVKLVQAMRFFKVYLIGQACNSSDAARSCAWSIVLVDQDMH